MCYYYDRRDTDERCLPLRLGNYSVALGEERDGVISYFYRNYYHLLFLQRITTSVMVCMITSVKLNRFS